MTRKVILALLILPFLCSEGLSQSRIFWADPFSYEIHSARLDGTGDMTIDRYNPMQGMTIDVKRGFVYYVDYPWGHGLYGELRRVPFTGGQDETLVDVDYIDGGLAIDYVADKMYMAVPFDLMHVTIVRTNLDGTNLEKLAPEVSDRCRGIALDQVGRSVFWTTGESILRLGMSDLVIEDVTPDVAAAPYPTNFDAGIAIDEGARKMYWAQQGSRTSSSGAMKIFRANLDGTNVELVFQDYYSETGSILIDRQNHYLYWEQWPAYMAEEGLRIRRARTDAAIPFTGTSIQEIVGPPATPNGLSKGIALFLDPGPALLESPTEEAAGVSTSTELRWRRVECSPRYDVQVASDADFANIVFRSNTPHNVELFVAPVAQHRYWWRVHSNACGIASHWTMPRWFDVGSSGPLAPTLLSPSDGEVTGESVAFSWTPGPEAAYHRFQLSTVNDFSTTLVNADSVTTNVVDVGDLMRGQTYYWRVAGFDDEGRYTFSVTQPFSVANEPSPISLLLPADGAVEVPAYAEFSWSPGEGADSYRFELSNATDFAAVVIDTMVTETTFQMKAPLAYAAEHFWRVCGVNIVGEGPWSSRSFTVAVGTAAEPDAEVPQLTELGPAFPNPASGMIHLPVSLPESGRVGIAIYDVFGRRVASVADRTFAAGGYTLDFDVSHLSSGTYIAVLTAGSFTARKSIVVVR